MQAVFEPMELGRFTEISLPTSAGRWSARGSNFVCPRCETFSEPDYVDRDMWEKIILNLISERLEIHFHGTVTVELRAVGPNAELTVRDTGTGIPEKDRLHIFERFHRVEECQR